MQLGLMALNGLRGKPRSDRAAARAAGDDRDDDDLDGDESADADYAGARAHFERAVAISGAPAAEHALGFMAQRGLGLAGGAPDAAAARAHYAAAERLGFADSATALGLMYLDGQLDDVFLSALLAPDGPDAADGDAAPEAARGAADAAKRPSGARARAPLGLSLIHI